MKNDKDVKNDYYIGLDIGTDSIGYAVTDTEYKIITQNKKAFWGVRLFDSGKTAEERRVFRTGRRRLARRRARITLLQEIFDGEISKIDSSFFARLHESKYLKDDKSMDSIFSLFNDKSYTDVEFFKQFPTNYHLRNFLIETKEPYDIRLLYLGVHNIIKRRGHFLAQGENISSVTSFDAPFNELCDYIEENELEVNISKQYKEIIETLLRDRSTGLKEKEKQLKGVFGKNDEATIAAIKLTLGGKVKLCHLFNDDSIEDNDSNKITFAVSDFESEVSSLAGVLDDKVEFITCLKKIYDWSILVDILRGHEFISKAKIEDYKQHEKDVKELKLFIEKQLPKGSKTRILRAGNISGNYASYSRVASRVGKKYEIEKYCTQEDFCKFLKKEFKDIKSDKLTEAEKDMLKRIDNDVFAPKQLMSDNSTIPYQVHKAELDAILKNASNYFQFLDKKDITGYSPMEKIGKLLTFRIPYYIGPINNAHPYEKGGHAWIVKRSNEKVTPWNFKDVVDEIASAERFINRMTSHCTYLIGAPVLPKQSLLYSEFMVLNELNNLRVNDKYISVEAKQLIFDKLFHEHRNVTIKHLKNFLLSNEIVPKSKLEDIKIDGIDDGFKSSLTAYHDFKGILKFNSSDRKLLEDLIHKSVILGEDKKLFGKYLDMKYSQLQEDVRKIIVSKRYTGWGRLSEKLLAEIYHEDNKTGECRSIRTMLYETNDNLMELLSSKYNFIEFIENYNKNMTTEKQGYEMINELNISPKVKRGVWQAMLIVDEIRKLMGEAPKIIFVETTRGIDDPNNKRDENNRSKSRQKLLISLYKKCKNEERDWLKELGGKETREFRNDRLYLYYTQKGECMYCGKQITIDQLLGDRASELYDIDHIYPKARTKDNSINNRVLVCKSCNGDKLDKYPITAEIRNKRSNFWAHLSEKKLISGEKLTRLTRGEELTDKELADFINRQLVETGQSTKAVCELLRKQYGNEKIVYVKAGNVTDFRHEYKMYKCRSINDFHHAKDAYLNIVVGNVYDKKFTRTPLNFIQKARQEYSLKNVFKSDINGAWASGDNGTIITVREVMNKNNILFTRFSYVEAGGFTNQQPLRKGKGQLPIKPSDPLLSKYTKMEIINRYGGYDSVKGSYFVLVESGKEEKKRFFEYVPIYIANQIKDDENKLIKYLESTDLVNPKVLINKVKINTLFCLDGFYMHLSGRSGNSLVFKGAIQMILSKKHEEYIRKLVKFSERLSNDNELKVSGEFDKITPEENIELYDEFLRKLNESIYKVKLGKQGKSLSDRRGDFKTLEIEKQCQLLLNILNLFACNSVASNLSLLKGLPVNAGILTLPKVVSSDIKLSIVHQSITGIYQSKIELSKL